MKKTLDIPVQIRLAELSSVDKEARTVRMVWSTGAEVKRVDFWTDQVWIEELSMEPAAVRMGRLNSGAPLLDTHGLRNLDSVLGVTEKAWLEGGEGMAIVRFVTGDDAVDRVWNKVQQGIVRNVSVGYKVHKFQDVSTKEDVASQMRRMRAIDWEPMEVSLVPIGADAAAGVRSEASKYSCDFEFSERSDEVRSAAEVAAEIPKDDTTAGQAAPPATRGGVDVDLLRRYAAVVARG